jgi:tRNA dimethylallyltransferase
MVATKPRTELLVIVGPTASGKSDLALRIAKEFKGEIISADSWTVYRGFDIGTSKPTTTQQKAVKHHLIDAREPTDGFNAPMFKKLAETAIEDIQKRGKLPILAGGTGLYIDSVLYDFGFLPDTPKEERERLNRLSIQQLINFAERLNIDLTDIDTRNKRRIIRAIEAKGQKPTKQRMRANTLIIGLRIEQGQLRQKVEHRVEEMINAGLAQEIKGLADKFGWEIEPMKGIGYREWREYFEGSQNLEQTKARIVSATMNLAKRQRTWFKRNQKIQWFSSVDEAVGFIKTVLNN